MVKRKDLLIEGITTKAAAPAWLSLPGLRERAFHRVLRFLLLTPRTCVCDVRVYVCTHVRARVRCRRSPRAAVRAQEGQDSLQKTSQPHRHPEDILFLLESAA